MKLALFLCFVALWTAAAAQEQSQRPVWYTYRSDLLPYENKMNGVYDCVFSNKEQCSSVEQEVKDVFKSFYVNHCSDCCTFRRNMVNEFMTYFETHHKPLKNQQGMKKMLEGPTNSVDFIAQ